MLRIIADENIPFLKGVLEPYADIKYLPGSGITNDFLLKADALLIRTRTKCTGDLLGNTAVKFIGTATIGFDHIDTQYCEQNNIKWINAPGCNSLSVQQYIAAALLKISHEYRFTLKGRTIGIVGAGNVGSKVAAFAELVGMNVLLNDPPRARNEGNDKFTGLDTLLSESDIVTIHVPLNVVGEDATWHLFDSRAFRKMKKGAWFINSSRGEVVDTAALKKAITSRKIDGAVLDVWENEPDIDRELMNLTFLSTPHIAGYSTDGKANGTAMVVNELAAFFNLPLHDWYPDSLPASGTNLLRMDCSGMVDEDVIRQAVTSTYNIDEDNIQLRFAPSDFEKLRSNYRNRREFPAFKPELKNCPGNVEAILKKMGFGV